MGDLSRVSGRHCEAADVSYHQDFLRFYQTFFFDRNLQDYSENLFLEISPANSPGSFASDQRHIIRCLS